MNMNDIISIEKVRISVKILRAIWNVICFLLFRPFPTKLFWWWRWILLRLFGAKVHFGAHVYSSVSVWAPWNLKMAKGSCLGPHVICYNQALVTLKENAIVSQYAYLCTAGHETDKPNTAGSGLIVAPITIDKNTWIGTRAYINMGVEIGVKAIVGATASVFKDVEPWTIVGGNPAKFIKKRVIADEQTS
jgi:putative colanic acid biosynthesis acetyltransferase WcaF